jgi:hypothetical protein
MQLGKVMPCGFDSGISQGGIHPTLCLPKGKPDDGRNHEPTNWTSVEVSKFPADSPDAGDLGWIRDE